MKDADLRRALASEPIAGEDGARVRAWEVVRAAYAEREPVSWPRRHSRPLLAAAVAFAAITAAVSPPGRAVLGSLRESIGIERAQPSLFSLPAKGRLLVVSAEAGGAWVVARDGSRRRLGGYADATWSPHGLFVAAVRRNELAAVEPDGDVRWTLPRRDVARPRWAGTRTDTRIAYVARSGLRVVAGDGTGDRLLDAFGDLPSWRPSRLHELAYTAGTAFVVVHAVDQDRVLWRTPQGKEPPIDLAWSSDGERLAVVSPHGVRFLDGRGRLVRAIRVRATIVNASFRPRSHVLALHLRHEPRGALEETDRRSEIRLVDADRAGRSRQLLPGTGVFGELAWSPDARWLLVDWRTADQWLFIRRAGRPKAVAVGNVSAQFGGSDGARPELLILGRWCC